MNLSNPLLRQDIKKAFPALLVLLSLGALLHLALDPDSYQWDFKTYYSAAVAFLKGMNPYSLDVLRENSATNLQFKYVYPPLTLWAFVPFSLMPYYLSATLFLLLKAASIILLVRLWNKHFLPPDAGIFFLFFCLFAFNGTLYRDFEAGNISVFEQLLLWTGFYFFLKGKNVAFCILILIAASFKLTPLLFLALLWITDDPRRHLYIAGSVALFASSLILTSLISPFLFAQFMSNLDQPPGRGFVNPSTLMFVTDGLEYLGRGIGFRVSPDMPLFLYAVSIIAVLFIAFGNIRHSLPAKGVEARRLLLFFSIVTYTLILPRFKDYSFVLLLVPSFVILLRMQARQAPFLIFLLFMVPFGSTFPGMSVIAKYSSLLMAFLVFLFYLPEPQEWRGPYSRQAGGDGDKRNE